MAVGTMGALGGAARLVAKPVTDLYETVKKEIKSQAKQWSAISDIESIYEKLSSVGEVRTITSSVPIPLSKFYYPAKLEYPGPEKTITAHYLSEISSGQSVLILGGAGQGKSTFLRYLCVQELEKGERVPIFIELREVDEKNTLRTLLTRQLAFLGVRDPDDSLVQFFLDSGKFVYFLDGFDEIKREHAHGVQTDLKAMMAAHPKTQWVVSSRKGSFGEHLSALPGLARFNIAALGFDDFSPFFCALGIPDEVREKLLTAVKASPTSVRNVLTTPLMLTLLNSTFGASTVIPPTLHEFYENMFHVLVSRHDNTKTFYCRQKATNLSNADLQSVFSAFCFVSKDVSVSLTDEQFSVCAKNAMKLTDHNFTADGFKTDLLDSVCLMVRDGLKTAFIHKSIQEFFAAYFVKTLTDEEKVQRIYEKYRLQKWPSSQAELGFLEQIDKHRFLLFYKFPAISEFQKRTGYSKTARVAVTKKSFDQYISSLEMYMWSIPGLKEPLLTFVIDDASIDPITCEFFSKANRHGSRAMLSKDTLEEITSSMDRSKLLRFDKYLKANPKDRDYFSTKLNEYLEKIEKERVKQAKGLSDIDKQFDEILGI